MGNGTQVLAYTQENMIGADFFVLVGSGRLRNTKYNGAQMTRKKGISAVFFCHRLRGFSQINF